MKKIWIFAIVFALLSISFITTAPPMPRTIYGHVDIDGSPIPSGIPVTIYNQDLDIYANTTTTAENSSFVTAISANLGDTIRANCTYLNQVATNTTIVKDALLQYLNLSLPALPENRNPVADANGPYNGRPNESITFDASDSYDPDGDTLYYRWKFDDGNCDCEWTSWKILPTEIFTYDKIGEFVANLEVVDGNGGFANDTASVTISNVTPIADFTYEPTNPKANNIIQFIDQSTDPQGDIIIWEWSFGDGGTSNMRNPFYVFSSGTYIIELMVTDIAGHSDQITKTIIIGNGGDDTIPPSVEITSIELGDKTISFEWNGSDAVTPTSSLLYSCILDSFDSWSSWTSATSKTYTDLVTGDYTFKVKAKDEAGNIGFPATWPVHIYINETMNASECLLLNMITDKYEYNIGEIVDISLEATNLCNQSVNVTFTTTQTYDFKILNESGGEIYRWSFNRSFAQSITTVVWSPHETRWNNISWNQLDNNGSGVPVGEYRIIGWLPCMNMTFENETMILIVNETVDENETYNLTVNVEGAEQSTIQIYQSDEKIDEAVGSSATFTLDPGVYDIRVLSSKGEKTMTIDLAGDTIKTVDFNEKDTPVGFGVLVAGLVIAVFLYRKKDWRNK